MIAAFGLTAHSHAQQSSPPVNPKAPSPSATPPPEKQDYDVVKINTNLVQVDAVVTDKDGHQVKDLSASDFDIVENGQVRHADYCSYVSLAEQGTPTGPATLPAPGQLTAADLRRTFVFVVADPVIVIAVTLSTPQGLKSWTISQKERPTRSASQEAAKLLRWFVDEKMGPNDLVAISSVEFDLGVLASFTSDKQVLHAASEQLRNGPMNQSVPPVVIHYFIDTASPTKYTYALESLIRQNLSVIETASRALAQVQTLPGRKFLILISRGMSYDPRLPGTDAVRARMDQLIGRANRAHVTFYTLSPTDIGNFGGHGTSGLIAAGMQGIEDIDSLVHLATETGGRAIYNTNDTRVGFADILEENRGYYLLAYNPGAEATGRPHRILVRLKRPGLRVRARTEAYSQAANDDRKTITAAETFNTPLAVRDIRVALNPTIAESSTNSKRIVTTTLAVGLSDVEARSKDSDGQVFALEILARIVGPDGRVVKENGENLNFKMNAANLETALREGLVSQFEFEATKAGFYRICVGVRDTVSGRVGSATRFVEVPAARARK
jgi:VWFA-related protein